MPVTVLEHHSNPRVMQNGNLTSVKIQWDLDSMSLHDN